MAVVLTHNAPASSSGAFRPSPTRPAHPRRSWWSTTPASPPVTARAVGRGRLPVPGGALGDQHRARRRLRPGPGRVPRVRATARLGARRRHASRARLPRAPVGGGRPRTRRRPSSSRCPGSSDGSLGVWPSWCGFVVARQIVEAVGLPMAELFWWAEDTEYLQWRIPEAGYQQQVVQRRHRRPRRHPPGWRRPALEVLLRGPQHALCASACQAPVGRYPRNMSHCCSPGPCFARSTGGCGGWRSWPGGCGRGPGPARHPLSGRADAGAHQQSPT